MTSDFESGTDNQDRAQDLPKTSLERQALSIMNHNREGAYGSQEKRGNHLRVAARMLHREFGLQKWENLKLKHVQYVIEQWKAQEMCCSECRRKTKAGKTDRR